MPPGQLAKQLQSAGLPSHKLSGNEASQSAEMFDRARHSLSLLTKHELGTTECVHKPTEPSGGPVRCLALGQWAKVRASFSMP